MANISLTPQLEEFVRERVKSGRYLSASEVVREGLRLLEEKLEALPPHLKARVKKQFDLLRADLRHPSLRAKKYDERRDLWQGRVTRDWRFYFTIAGDTYEIVAKWSTRSEVGPQQALHLHEEARRGEHRAAERKESCGACCQQALGLPLSQEEQR